jgi:hypothetical protein
VQDKISVKQREIEELEENLKDINDETNNTNTNISNNNTDKEEENIKRESDKITDNESDDNSNIENENATEIDSNDFETENINNNANAIDNLNNETLTSNVSTKDIQNAIKQANNELENLQKELTNLERNPISQPDYTLEETEYDTWQSKKSSLEDTLHSAKQSLEDAERTRTSTLRQKQRDIASAEVYSSANSTDKIYEIQISDMEKEIAALQAIQNANGKITAPNNGYISSILVSTGTRTTDSPAIILNDMSADCKFSCSITTEQSKYIHLNDTLELTLNGNQKSKATIDYYTQNSQGGYNITCKLSDVTAQIGTSLTAIRTVQGDLQTLTIPIDAIHEENNATYIYTLSEKSSILGNEYYTEKIKVQISDKNDTYAAIESGVISSDTNVIIYSSNELEQGEVVRVSD